MSKYVDFWFFISRPNEAQFSLFRVPTEGKAFKEVFTRLGCSDGGKNMILEDYKVEGQPFLVPRHKRVSV